MAQINNNNDFYNYFMCCRENRKTKESKNSLKVNKNSPTKKKFL